MSLRVGLGASQYDLEVQGEIDFDFFASDEISEKLTEAKQPAGDAIERKEYDEGIANSPIIEKDDCKNFHLPSSGNNVKPPVITVSYNNSTGAIQKTVIETVIPSPSIYSENKRARNRSYFHSHTKSDDSDGDSSGGSLSSSMSESDISASLTEDSFEQFAETDSMTDVTPIEVTPLPSPLHCITPTKKLELEKNTKSKSCLTAKTLPQNKHDKKERVKFSEDIKEKIFNKSKDPVDINKLLKAIKKLEIEQNSKFCNKQCSTPLHTNSNKHRKNMSFTNEEVYKIDQENQRLLKKIMAQQNRSRPKVSTVSSNLPTSAVNRQKQQRQIEIENVALLKRLEAAKPSRDLSRMHLTSSSSSMSSSRASTRVPSVACSSHLSSCRSSALSSGRSSSLSINKASKTQPTLLCNKIKKSNLISASRKPEWQN